MKEKYRYTRTTVSLINYHIVFCPRYRRKIFLIPHVEDRFKELMREKCEAEDIRILAMECDQDHVHLFINVPPKYSIPALVQKIKGFTSRQLRDEFPELSRMPGLWTRSYFISTAGNVSSETIRRYVENQKKRYL